MKFKARYYNGNNSTAEDVNAELWSNRIYIITATGNEEWFFKDIIIQEKPSRLSQGKITCNNKPNAQLVISDKTIFKEIAAKVPAIKKYIKYKTTIAFITSIALLLFAVLYIVPALTPTLARYIPNSWEEKMGNYVTNVFTSTHKVCKQSDGQKALEKIMANLAANTNSNYKFRITVIEEKETNALAAPAGSLIFFSGLIDKATTESEISGIMAHEMGHVVMHHGTESLTRTLMISFLLDVMTGGGGSSIYLANQALQNDYSQTAETEADKFGLNLLRKSNISAQGFYDFFQRLEPKEKNSIIPDFLSTHPASYKRMKMIKTHIVQDSKASSEPSNILTEQEFKALKGICND